MQTHNINSQKNINFSQYSWCIDYISNLEVWYHKYEQTPSNRRKDYVIVFSSRSFSNSEAKASELLKDLEEMHD